MPVNWKRYPPDWKMISMSIIKRSGGRCECTGECGTHKGRGGAFNNPRSKLNTGGYVVYKGKSLALTDAGRERADCPLRPLTVSDLQRHVISVLPAPHLAILKALIGMYPNPVTKETLSEVVGKRGGAFNNPLSRLRTMGLIEYPTRGYVVAKPFLFLE